MSGFIGADALEAGLHGHADRTQLFGPRPTHRIVSSLQVDADEFQAAAQVLRDHRAPDDDGIYAAGVLDGFVLGVRAARSARELKDGDHGE
jgi:hypothetical protein